MKILFMTLLLLLVTATTRASAAAAAAGGRPLLRKTSLVGVLDDPKEEEEPAKKETTKTTSGNNNDGDGGGGTHGDFDEPQKGPSERGEMDDPDETNTEAKEPAKKEETKTTSGNNNSNGGGGGVRGKLDEPQKSPSERGKMDDPDETNTEAKEPAKKEETTKTTSDDNNNKGGGGGGVVGDLNDPKKAGEKDKTDDPDETTTETGEMEEPHAQAEMMTTVKVRAKDVSGEGGNATFLLYAYDRQLADASAYEVNKKTVMVPPNEDLIITSLSFDRSANLRGSGGQKWDDLVDPSLYIVLDDEASTLTVTPDQDRVIFGVRDGATIPFSLQQKESNQLEVTVVLTEIHGMGGKVVLNLVAVSETEGDDFKGSSLAAQRYDLEVPADGTAVETKLAFESWSKDDWQQMSNPAMYLTVDELRSDLKMTRKTSKNNQVSVTPGEVVEIELKSVATRVEMTVLTYDVDGLGGKATFAVYVYEDPIGDSTATLAQKVEIPVPAKDEPKSRNIGFDGTKVVQDGKTWFEMSNATMQLTLFQEDSDLRPADKQDEIIMGIQPGDQVTYELRQKKQSE